MIGGIGDGGAGCGYIRMAIVAGIACCNMLVMAVGFRCSVYVCRTRSGPVVAPVAAKRSTSPCGRGVGGNSDCGERCAQRGSFAVALKVAALAIYCAWSNCTGAADRH